MPRTDGLRHGSAVRRAARRGIPPGRRRQPTDRRQAYPRAGPDSSGTRPDGTARRASPRHPDRRRRPERRARPRRRARPLAYSSAETAQTLHRTRYGPSPHKTPAIAKSNGVGAVDRTKLLEQPASMGLHSVLRQEQGPPNLGVAPTLAHTGEDLQLALGEDRRPTPRHQPRGGGHHDRRGLGQNLRNGGTYLGSARVLVQVSTSAGSHGRHHSFLVVRHGQDDQFGRWIG